MSEVRKAKVLLVDDEPNLLESVSRIIRPDFEVFNCASGSQALELIQLKGPIEIIISDLRMPMMDGITFLTKVKELYSDTVGLLLTGQADLEAAISAVNSNVVFRFLNKPCAPDILKNSLKAALNQFRLVTAEKILLAQTLHGSIKALTEILSMTNPVAFGRATRVKSYVQHLAPQLGIKNEWEIEIAAMMSQIGGIVVPPEVLQKMYKGEELKVQSQQ